MDCYGNERDGECDFVVAHERLGILAIEVKGGGIDFDPARSQWTSTDAHGVIHNIKDPVNQVRSAKYNILDKFKDSGKWTQRWITLRHGVILPDAATPTGSLGADRPARIFCASYQFRNDFVGWIYKRLCSAEDDREDSTRLGRDGIAVLERLFAHPFTLGFRISASISEDVQSIDLLESQQYLVLDYISNIPRVRIEGAAGTGKTVLALEAAIRSGRGGTRTLITCYNSPLATELRRRLDGVANVTVATFHRLCLFLAQAVGLQVAPIEKNRSYFEEYLPELVMEAFCKDDRLRFDCIIVDEGQDFLENWWVALDEALIEGGSIRVFFDSNQRLYSHHSEFVSALDLVPIPLNRNLRNTQRIHDASMVHYSGLVTTAPGPLGMELKWVETGAVPGLTRAAFNEVKRLVYQEELDPAEIAILVTNSEERDAFMIAAAHSGIPFAGAENLSRNAVVVDTIRRFKGLERTAIVLCIAGTETGQTELAYVGMTRARAALSIVCQPKDRHWIENGWRIQP